MIHETARDEADHVPMEGLLTDSELDFDDEEKNAHANFQ
jgi:hypothetical protein